MAGVVWAKLISFELQPQMHKSYNGAHTESMHWVMLKYWYALQGSMLKVKAELTEICPLVAWCPAILSFQTDIDASLLNCVCSGGVWAVIVRPEVFQCSLQYSQSFSSGNPVCGSFNIYIDIATAIATGSVSGTRFIN